MREFLALTDIPSGYRVHEFRILSQVLGERDIGFRVLFLSRGQKGRQWRYRSEDFGFDHIVGRGPTFYLSEHLPVHFNPGLWVGAVRARPRWLLLGGSWYQPAVLASAFLNTAEHVLFWNESWEPSSGGRRLDPLRRRVLGRCDGFVAPGQRAEVHVRSLVDRPVLRFPNTVDEAVFRDETARVRVLRDEVRRSFGFGEETVFAWPARLNRVKGIVPFLESVRGIGGDYGFAIAGDGPQRDEIERLVAGMPNVRLLGHLWPRDLIRLYAAADALLLPSLFEPFGFVAVEALWAGLPLFLSGRVGAVPEVVVDGENGWVVDVEDRDAVRTAFAAAVGLGRDGLAKMGDNSLRIAERRFDSRACAEGFADRLLEAFPA